MSKALSIIIPAFNEEAVLPELFQRLENLKLQCQKEFDFKKNDIEIIFVIDQPTDQTVPILKKQCEENDGYITLNLSQRSGQYVAVSAGLRHCTGETVVVMDADLQDPPELILDFYREYKNGYDVVYGVRGKRKGESFVYRILCSIFYRMLNSLTRIKIPNNMGEFRLMSRRVVDAYNKLSEKHRYFRGLISWIGFKQKGVTYSRDSRYAGTTNYPIGRAINYAIDGITSFSSLPLRVISYFGLFVAICGFVFTGYIFYLKLVLNDTGEGWASIVSLILMIGGVQLIALGVIGEYIGRIFDEVKGRPLYFIQDEFRKSNK